MGHAQARQAKLMPPAVGSCVIRVYHRCAMRRDGMSTGRGAGGLIRQGEVPTIGFGIGERYDVAGALLTGG